MSRLLYVQVLNKHVTYGCGAGSLMTMVMPSGGGISTKIIIQGVQQICCQAQPQLQLNLWLRLVLFLE